jgi:[protein-PII] uridylyltransferase
MIKSARIATYGERAVDAFYVTDALGDKIESKQKLRAIEKKLLAVLEDGDCAPAQKPAKPTQKPGGAGKAEAAKKATAQKNTAKAGKGPKSVTRKAVTARAGTRKAPARKSR